MILKALYDYYHASKDLPPLGMEDKEIAYIIVIDKEGNFKRIESKEIEKGRYATFRVAKSVTRTSNPQSNILWDNGKYVLGLNCNDKKEQLCHDLFINKVKELSHKNPEDVSLSALCRFYANGTQQMVQTLQDNGLLDKIKQNYQCNFSFQLEGENIIVAQKSELYSDIISEENDDNNIRQGVCLITGERGSIVKLTSPTPIPKTAATASLVGIQTNSGYDSYGKTQAYNSPISPNAEFAFTTALNILKGKDSKNKIRFGNRLFLFWCSKREKESIAIEESLYSFFNLESSKEKNPNKNITKVKEVFKSIWSGDISITHSDQFFILGLSPNNGRIAVVFWAEMTLKELANKILQHFDNMEIIDYRYVSNRRPYCGIYSMLTAVTLDGKISDVTPNLPEELSKSIFDGTPYPFTLYTSALERIRAELSKSRVSITRAAILKAYINRKSITNKHLKIMLDKENTNPGYLCGRLAAVLEKIQEEAECGDSIRTRYMGAASATPSAVFPSMMNVSTHHSEKLSEGRRINFERLKAEIVSKIPSSGFPAHLNLIDQGCFFVGYYHQRADLFTPKSTEE